MGHRIPYGSEERQPYFDEDLKAPAKNHDEQLPTAKVLLKFYSDLFPTILTHPLPGYAVRETGAD